MISSADGQGDVPSRRVRVVAACAGAAGILIGASTTAGWILDAAWLRTFGAPALATAPLTAMLLMLLGAAVVVWSSGESQWARTVTIAAAGVACLVAALVLLDQLTGVRSGLAPALVELYGSTLRDDPTQSVVPATQTSLAIMMLGVGFIAARASIGRKVTNPAATFFTIAGLSVAGQAAVAYVFGADDFLVNVSNGQGGMALPTALALLAIGGGAILLTLGAALGRLRADQSAWRIVAFVLPAAAVIPMVRVAATQTMLSAGGQVAALGILAAAILLAVLVSMVLSTAFEVQQIDQDRIDLVERLPVSAVVEQRGEIVHANPAAVELFAGRGIQVVGNHMKVETLLGTDPSAIDNLREKALSGYQAASEIRCIGPDHGELTYEVTAQHTRWHDRPAMMLVVVDRTDEKKIVSSLEAARAEAARSNDTKSEFLSRMSHELRTPLNAVIGFAQVLRYSDHGDGNLESIDAILKAGRHLLELVDEVLDLAQVEAGRVSISPEPVLIADLIIEAVSLIQPAAEAASIALDSVCSDDPSCRQYVLADRRRSVQILLNFLSNAVKYNRPNGSITLSCDGPENDTMRVNVTDTGNGVRGDQIEMLFKPFERLGSETSAIEGTGIGLALSKRLAEAMGGRLGVTSTPGRGSTFWCELPLVEGQQDRLVRLNCGSEKSVADRHAAPEPAGAAEGNLTAKEAAEPERPVTVLHIEDNLANVSLVERIFELYQRPVELVAAMHGRLGLDLARKKRPDLILLDLHLPDMDGDALVRQLREDPATATIPVIIISADATPSRVARVINAGASAYLTKPIDLADLMGQLDRLLPPPDEST